MSNSELYEQAEELYEDFYGIDYFAYNLVNETKTLLMIATIAAQLVLKNMEDKNNESI